MEFPKDLYYTREHEWIRIEGHEATIGITDFAQDQLGDIVFVDLPEVDDEISKDESFGTIESVKAVSDVYAPVTGVIIEVNDSLPDNPEVINEDPYGDAWLIRVRLSDTSELEDLMSSDEYQEYIAEQNIVDEEEDFDD